MSRLGDDLPFGLPKGANATLEPAPHAPWLEGSVWRADNEARNTATAPGNQQKVADLQVEDGRCQRNLSGRERERQEKASGWVWEEMAAFLEEAAGIKSPWKERRVWRTYPL